MVHADLIVLSGAPLSDPGRAIADRPGPALYEDQRRVPAGLGGEAALRHGRFRRAVDPGLRGVSRGDRAGVGGPSLREGPNSTDRSAPCRSFATRSESRSPIFPL